MMKLSLKELAEHVGMKPRTVRSYIEKRLLPGPEASGPSAYYGFRHLERLKAIIVLREIDGLSLDDTRRRLLTLGGDEIRDIAARLEEWRNRPEINLLEELPSALGGERAAIPQRSVSYASDGLSEVSLKEDHPIGGSTARDEIIQHRISTPSRRASSAFRLGDGSHSASRKQTIPRRARAEPMVRIEITPDIDLVVRGVQDEDQIKRLERVADYVRNALLTARGED